MLQHFAVVELSEATSEVVNWLKRSLQNSEIFPKSQSSPRWVGVQLIVSLHPLPNPPAVAVLPALCLSPNREMIWWYCEIDQHFGAFQILYNSRSNSMIYHDLSSQSYLDELFKKDDVYHHHHQNSFAMWFTPLPKCFVEPRGSIAVGPNASNSWLTIPEAGKKCNRRWWEAKISWKIYQKS